MQAIPVIDLMGGAVVRGWAIARRTGLSHHRFANQRHCRRRARTSLSLSVSHSLNVADFEAIERNGENLPALRIREEFPAVRVGIDNGAADPAALEALIGADWTRPSSEANLGATPR